jgi:hypothetical protein
MNYMKNLFLFSAILLVNISYSQVAKVSFDTDERLINVGDTVQLTAIASGILEGTLKWKIGGEEGKDWKFLKGYDATNEVIKVYFKKIGPANVTLSAKFEKSVTKKENGKEKTEKVKESIKCDKKSYFLVTEKGEYSELNQLYAEATVDSYIKLVKKAAKLTENTKYAKDPFAYIWLARGLYAIYGENLDFTIGKYAAYKTAFQDATSALSKALKNDKNGFLDHSKFAEFIFEFQNKYFVEVLGEQLEKEADKIDYTKINSALGKYVKITKNPISVKYFQIACMYRLNDQANAKIALKEADLQLAQLGDSAVFSETDKLFFARSIVELIKYYESKKQANSPCDLLKRVVIAIPSLLEEQDKYEDFRERHANCD